MAKYKNHLKLGKSTIIHKNYEIVTSLLSLDFENAINQINSLPFKIGTIPPGYEHRADRIADLFYGEASLDWIVCWTNGIYDPFQQLNIGDRIKIVELA